MVAHLAVIAFQKWYEAERDFMHGEPPARMMQAVFGRGSHKMCSQASRSGEQLMSLRMATTWLREIAQRRVMAASVSLGISRCGMRLNLT